eukprot:1053544-Alexandrium_andersonii.AAC.1
MHKHSHADNKESRTLHPTPAPRQGHCARPPMLTRMTPPTPPSNCQAITEATEAPAHQAPCLLYTSPSPRD